MWPCLPIHLQVRIPFGLIEEAGTCFTHLSSFSDPNELWRQVTHLVPSCKALHGTGSSQRQQRGSGGLRTKESRDHGPCRVQHDPGAHSCSICLESSFPAPPSFPCLWVFEALVCYVISTISRMWSTPPSYGAFEVCQEVNLAARVSCSTGGSGIFVKDGTVS